jgi:hypothetical protein
MTITLEWPVPSGMIVVVGWMIVPLAERSAASRRQRSSLRQQ